MTKKLTLGHLVADPPPHPDFGSNPVDVLSQHHREVRQLLIAVEGVRKFLDQVEDEEIAPADMPAMARFWLRALGVSVQLVCESGADLRAWFAPVLVGADSKRDGWADPKNDLARLVGDGLPQ